MQRKTTKDPQDELQLLRDADARAARYIARVGEMPVFPDAAARQQLARFDEPLPDTRRDATETLALLDEAGSPATTVSNGPRYFGFVIGATLPVAAAAQRLASAWDQCASSQMNSPVADKIEKVAARWLLEILDLPRESGVAFGTSATASTLVCLSVARRELLKKEGWDFDAMGLLGAPEIKVVVSELAHITVLKALRILGFGQARLIKAPVDSAGRIDPARLPALDRQTILCLQAGEVNTGSFDPFLPLIERAKEAGAWVHVDGAFGLWARAAPAKRGLTNGIEGADSWTTDGHKWLNTPYDGAAGICRDRDAMAAAMNSDAVYSTASTGSQKNLGIEFSRSARGVPIWAVLRTLGRAGVAELVERHCSMAARIAKTLPGLGFELLCEPALNQILFRYGTEAQTRELQQLVERSGKAWFGGTVWNGEPALRISVSSWRTSDQDIDILLNSLQAARDSLDRKSQ
ncbi:aminotransferase class V-fold PLP-dependent enzyme [Leisingera sp. M523]|uniref:pyridoxal phosphate-dependent decarboxylase family protein n=1 Tax=Leisingera sp. M523 TaxID=2867013 RepID=UPI0021A4E144|nr:aminotransferase class V-fold PLP-dependent enzyme [Leisingera sp. M523]UWQ28521.1 aminotransferase class V-fold PLP-dependent enzyme [Leisingera sp. M523]